MAPAFEPQRGVTATAQKVYYLKRLGRNIKPLPSLLVGLLLGFQVFCRHADSYFLDSPCGVFISSIPFVHGGGESDPA